MLRLFYAFCVMAPATAMTIALIAYGFRHQGEGLQALRESNDHPSGLPP